MARSFARILELYQFVGVGARGFRGIYGRIWLAFCTLEAREDAEAAADVWEGFDFVFLCLSDELCIDDVDSGEDVAAGVFCGEDCAAREFNCGFDFVFVAVGFIGATDGDVNGGGFAGGAWEEFVDFSDAMANVFVGAFVDVVANPCDIDAFYHGSPLDLFLAADVLLEDGGDVDFHVFGLVILDDGDHGATEGECGGVVGMDELDFARVTTDASFEAAGLVVGHVVGGVGFAIFALPW